MKQYLLTRIVYGEYNEFSTTPKVIQVESKRELVTYLIEKCNLYYYTEDLVDIKTEDDAVEILSSIKESNGDGCDYLELYPITITKNGIVKLGKNIL